MTPTLERITLDPSEVSTGRTSLDITPWIDHDGVDWGDAAIASFMSETDVGEVPVDFRMPNRQITIPLAFVNRGTVTAQQARAKVQRKIALFQREGGWLKRVTHRHGTIYADIVDGMFHASSAPGYASKQSMDLDASATLSVIPEFYGNEITLADHSTTTVDELVFSETTVRGDIPGRVRLVIDNDQASAQTSLIYGFRARNHDAATTAKLPWEVESFSTLGTGARASLAGASGGTVVADTSTAAWETVVSNNTFTHQGHYRVFARVYSSAATSQARFAYSTDGGVNVTYNDPVTVPSGSTFYVVDLGQVDVRKPPVGSSVWIGYLQGYGAAANIRFDRIWFVPADEYSGVIRSNAMLSAQAGNELRTEGYFANTSTGYYERPIYGDLPRIPVPKQLGGTVEVFLKASRGVIGDSTGIVATSDAGLADDISARITYRPSWLFVDDT